MVTGSQGKAARNFQKRTVLDTPASASGEGITTDRVNNSRLRTKQKALGPGATEIKPVSRTFFADAVRQPGRQRIRTNFCFVVLEEREIFARHGFNLYFGGFRMKSRSVPAWHVHKGH